MREPCGGGADIQTPPTTQHTRAQALLHTAALLPHRNAGTGAIKPNQDVLSIALVRARIAAAGCASRFGGTTLLFEQYADRYVRYDTIV